jgi:hypothetical protein
MGLNHTPIHLELDLPPRIGARLVSAVRTHRRNDFGLLPVAIAIGGLTLALAAYFG